MFKSGAYSKVGMALSLPGNNLYNEFSCVWVIGWLRGAHRSGNEVTRGDSVGEMRMAKGYMKYADQF